MFPKSILRSRAHIQDYAPGKVLIHGTCIIDARNARLIINIYSGRWKNGAVMFPETHFQETSPSTPLVSRLFGVHEWSRYAQENNIIKPRSEKYGIHAVWLNEHQFDQFAYTLENSNRLQIQYIANRHRALNKPAPELDKPLDEIEWETFRKRMEQYRIF